MFFFGRLVTGFGIEPRLLRVYPTFWEILFGKLQYSADEVAVAVGEIRVVAGDEGIEAEAAVLAEGDFAEQEVAEHVGGEEVALALGAFGELFGVDVLSEGFEDGLCADDVALRFRHLGVVEEQPAVRGDGLG